MSASEAREAAMSSTCSALTDSDVYDGVTISAVVALSEKSIAAKSAPVEFPDFTRGR